MGQPLTYTVTVTNNGPYPASGVVVTDRLDRSLRLRSARSGQGHCALRRRSTIKCNLGDLASGEEATATIVTRPTRSGIVTSVASAGDIEPVDIDQANNTAIAVTTVP